MQAKIRIYTCKKTEFENALNHSKKIEMKATFISSLQLSRIAVKL